MSYLREGEGLGTLPAINRGGMWDMPGGRRVASMEESLLDDRYATRSSHGAPRDQLFYPRPPSPTGRRQTDMQNEQLRFYREELAKKDRLISQITSLEAPMPRFSDTSKIDEMYSNDRIAAAATAKSEIAGLQVRVEGLTSQLRETSIQLEVREDKIKELKMQLEMHRENDAKSKAVMQELRNKLNQYEARAGNIEGVASRSELAIQTLQTQNKEYQERVMELENRLRTHLGERERAEQDIMMTEKKFHEMMAHFSSVLRFDDLNTYGPSSLDTLTTRITDVVQENALMKGKIGTMKEYMNTAELENKASRETIMRLVTEADRGQKTASRYTLEVDNLRLERDDAVARQRELQRETDLMRERLDSTQRAWEATKRELEDKEGRYGSYERDLRENQLAVRNADASHSSFKEQLASMLSGGRHGVVEPYEEQIRDRVQSLLLAANDKSAHIDMLEGKLNEVTRALEEQYERTRAEDRKVKRTETEFYDLEERCRKLEGELAAGDMLRDGLRGDKERYLRFLERVTMAMKLDPITSDVGLDSVTDAIIARAEQLTRNSADVLVDRKTHIYNLQRKVKSLKEQLESKDLHMDLLRKKVAALEERLLGRTEVEREKDEESMKIRKLVKLVDRYRRELNECHLEIRDLKARLLQSSDVMAQSYQTEKELENLEGKVGQLERVRQKQAHKITNLREEVSAKDDAFDTKRGTAQNTIHALSSELRTTRTALEEITKRERQLLDLRQVVARMLGLDVNTLAVPDYEVISRLEKLILANQSNASTAIAIDNAMVDMQDGFRAGYEDATHTLASRPRSPARRHPGPTRARSVSPSRKRDNRAY